MELAKELKVLTSKELDKEMMESIRGKLIVARDKAGLTQEKLAELADIQANSIYRYEAGERIPSFPTVVRMAKAMGVSVADLVPDDYLEQSADDPEGVLEVFYQMDVQDQKAFMRQMMAMLMMKKAS